MYCNNCGKENPVDSSFCKHCGSEIIKISVKEGKHIKPSQNKDKSLKVRTDEKAKVGIGGWLALVGLGLICRIFLNGYEALDYLPLLSDTYGVPGYLAVIRFEFLVMLVFAVASVYLLYLFFKKNRNFPNYYIILLVSSIVYVILDYIFTSSLTMPTRELQEVINDALSENSDSAIRGIISSVIWILYMKNSKRVKATFINN